MTAWSYIQACSNDIAEETQESLRRRPDLVAQRGGIPVADKHNSACLWDRCAKLMRTAMRLECLPAGWDICSANWFLQLSITYALRTENLGEGQKIIENIHAFCSPVFLGDLAR